ncbi:MAG: response regulator transcription factor [Melioribacter sp.]|nr:response regulator transcription factor [Melioribacter sp.]
MARILIIEDEPSMRMGLIDNLEFEGYETDSADDGVVGLEKINNGKYDLIILDLMLPRLSGFDVCKKIRESGNKTPVILLTAKGEEIDKVVGLEIGADDYITKPFSLRELIARIKAVLRRSSESDQNSNSIMIGKLELHFKTFNEFENGTEVQMSHREFELLEYLWNHRNQTVSRNSILKDVWKQEATTTRTIDNFILRLRQKIETDPDHPKIILTVHGIGYKLISG